MWSAHLHWWSVFFNQGQCCVAGSRVFVQESVYDEFVSKMTAKAKARRLGDPFHPDTEQGPQVSKEQQDRVRGYIEHGKRDGATLLVAAPPAAGPGTSSSRRCSRTCRTT